MSYPHTAFNSRQQTQFNESHTTYYSTFSKEEQSLRSKITYGRTLHPLLANFSFQVELLHF